MFTAGNFIFSANPRQQDLRIQQAMNRLHHRWNHKIHHQKPKTWQTRLTQHKQQRHKQNICNRFIKSQNKRISKTSIHQQPIYYVICPKQQWIKKANNNPKIQIFHNIPKPQYFFTFSKLFYSISKENILHHKIKNLIHTF